MSEQPPESERPQLNAIGKPLSPSFDPNYKVRTPLTSIGRLRASTGRLRAPMQPSLGVSSPDEEQRWRAVRECIAKGNKAKRKAEDFYITAGQHLKALKDTHDERGGTWAEWEALLKDKGISKSRASELMQIADGTKTVEEIRVGKAESMKRLRAKAPPRGGENAPEPEAAKKTTPTKTIPSHARREGEAAQAHAQELEAAREHDKDLAEKLRAAEIKIIGLESEIADLKGPRETNPDKDIVKESLDLVAQMTNDERQKFLDLFLERYVRRAAAPPKKRGRPPGAKNKPKAPPAEAVATATDTAAA
jgi:hypothetical protein